jgi:hypothetical protein
MGVDAIDQTICPSVLGMTKCSIAFGRWPHAIEHLVIPSTSETDENDLFVELDNNKQVEYRVKSPKFLLHVFQYRVLLFKY